MPTIKTPMGEMKLPYNKEGMAMAQQTQSTGVTPDLKNMNENPFMAILNGSGMGDMSQELPSPQGQEAMGQEGRMPQGKPMAVAQSNPAGEEVFDPREEQLKRGGNPSRSKSITTAITALESVASDSTDEQEIALLRGVLGALARLLSKNQDDLRGLL